jgi:hypothetical protein
LQLLPLLRSARRLWRSREHTNLPSRFSRRLSSSRVSRARPGPISRAPNRPSTHRARQRSRLQNRLQSATLNICTANSTTLAEQTLRRRAVLAASPRYRLVALADLARNRSSRHCAETDLSRRPGIRIARYGLQISCATCWCGAAREKSAICCGASKNCVTLLGRRVLTRIEYQSYILIPALQAFGVLLPKLTTFRFVHLSSVCDSNLSV